MWSSASGVLALVLLDHGVEWCDRVTWSSGWGRWRLISLDHKVEWCGRVSQEDGGCFHSTT
ncbi:unnamed protein product [Arabidopsis halleri]